MSTFRLNTQVDGEMHTDECDSPYLEQILRNSEILISGDVCIFG